MTRVSDWLTHETTRVAELPCLEDALVGFRPARYAVYRLRYVFVQALLRTCFRLIELTLFASALPFEVLGPVLVVRSSMLLGEGLWWGALEVLRGQVRTLMSEGRVGQASLRVRQWLALAVLLGLTAMGLGSLWVWLGPSPYRSFSVIDVFILGCCVRWGTDVLITTYHAGVYGVRRVYRPIFSLLSIDIADVVLLGAAYWWIGAWGVGLSLAVSGAIRAAVSWWFTRRVYAQLKLEVGSVFTWFRAWPKAVWTLRSSAEYAMSNVIAHVDALLVIGLLAAPTETEGTLLLAALFHVVTPLQAAASAWSRLFYFDFKRLEAWGSPLLLRRFEAFLRRVAWWTPIPVGVATLALMAVFWRGSYWLLTLELTCLAVVRSRLSLVHMRAYSLSDHQFLRHLFVGIFAVATITPFLAHLAPETTLATIVALAATVLFIIGRSQRPLEARPTLGLVEPSVWLAQLLRVDSPVKLGLARVDRRLSTVGRLDRALREALGDAVRARLTNDTLVWFQRNPSDEAPLLTLGAGALRELRFGEAARSGRNAFQLRVDSETWRRYWSPTLHLDAAVAPNLDALEQTLVTVHPGARLVALTSTSPLPHLDVQASRELRRLLLDAARGRSVFRKIGTSDVIAFAPAGEPLALVVIPQSARAPATWKGKIAGTIQRANVTWTLHADRSVTGAAVR